MLNQTLSAESAPYGQIRYTADAAVQNRKAYFKPSRRAALSDSEALLTILAVPIAWFAGMLVLVMLLRAFQAVAAAIWPIAVGAILLMAYLFIRDLPPVQESRERRSYEKRERSLRVQDDLIQQTEDDVVVSTIDPYEEYEYAILDRYNLKKAKIALYQGTTEMTFYASDPGASNVISNLMRIEWPPRPRHAGRSYPPSAV